MTNLAFIYGQAGPPSFILREGVPGQGTNQALFAAPSSLGFSRTALAWNTSCCLHGDKSPWLQRLGYEFPSLYHKKHTQHTGKMCRFTPLPVTLAKIGLMWHSGRRHKRWLENMLNSWWGANGGSLWQRASHWRGRVRQSQRYGWGWCDSCELSQCLLCQPTAFRKRRNTFSQTGPLN